jgi:hypothetical protein
MLGLPEFDLEGSIQWLTQIGEWVKHRLLLHDQIRQSLESTNAGLSEAAHHLQSLEEPITNLKEISVVLSSYIVAFENRRGNSASPAIIDKETA